MTTLPNPFLNSVTPLSPAVTDTAAADQVAPQVAAAELIDDSGAPQPRGEPAKTDATQPASSPNLPPSNERRPSEAPAPRCTEQHEGAGALDHIPEIFHWVRKLLNDDRRFALHEA